MNLLVDKVMIEMNLNGIYFDMIKSGEKIYEIRLNDEKRSTIKVGDKIKFYKEPQRKESIVTLVKNVIKYDNFLSMARNLDSAKIGFSNQSIDNIVNTYHTFYDKEKELKYGVVAFELEVL